MKLEGKCSFFGGAIDKGMKYDEGLSLYEHKEADFRPDLFRERSSDEKEGASQRLRFYANYLALRYDQTFPRWEWQKTVWKITNPKNDKFVIASLVDWGPHERTGRLVDISYGTGTVLGVKTDDIVVVERIA